MSHLKVKCSCGKFLDDPTHQETHKDNILTPKQVIELDQRWPRVVQTKIRNSVNEPWRLLYGMRNGATFQILGVYVP